MDETKAMTVTSRFSYLNLSMKTNKNANYCDFLILNNETMAKDFNFAIISSLHFLNFLLSIKQSDVITVFNKCLTEILHFL